jgi:hypothetical protein
MDIGGSGWLSLAVLLPGNDNKQWERNWGKATYKAGRVADRQAAATLENEDGKMNCSVEWEQYSWTEEWIG